MADGQTISRLLGTLYAAPTAPQLWQEFLRDASALAGVTKATLIGHDTVTNTHRVFGSLGEGLPESNALYEERYWEYDEWTRRGISRLAAGRVIIGDEVWPEPELLRSVFYNEFLHRLDIRSVASVGMGSIPRAFEALSFYGGKANPEFGPDEAGVLEMLHPHLQSALATARRLAALESRLVSIESALGLLESALVLLDEAGRVVFANQAAQRVLEQTRSLFLRGSRLAARGVAESAQIRDLIAKASATAAGKQTCGGGGMSIPREGQRPLNLLVSPLRSEDGALPGNAVVAVFLIDPARQTAAPENVLRSLFGLTGAEARLAIRLQQGHSLSETAELNHVSRETLKSQVGAVFSKTGTRCQADLIRLLTRIPGMQS